MKMTIDQFISERLKTVFLVSILAFYLHGMEEIYTGFPDVDVSIQSIAQYFSSLPQAVYWISHSAWWLFLAVIFFSLLGGRFILHLMFVYGIVLTFEFHHLMKAIVAWDYYPGAITGFFLFPILAFLFWKELLRNYKNI